MVPVLRRGRPRQQDPPAVRMQAAVPRAAGHEHPHQDFDDVQRVLRPPQPGLEVTLLTSGDKDDCARRPLVLRVHRECGREYAFGWALEPDWFSVDCCYLLLLLQLLLMMIEVLTVTTVHSSARPSISACTIAGQADCAGREVNPR